MTSRDFRQPLRVIASSCEAIQSRKQDWIASSQGLLAMTLRVFRQLLNVIATRWLAMTLRAAAEPKAVGAMARHIAPLRASPMAE
jgi:hypothetical protein